MALLIPGVERVKPTTVRFSSRDFVTAYRVLSAICIVGGAAFDGQL
jgi:D-aminopeptidase